MGYSLEGDQVAKKIQEVIDSHFEGVVAAFARRCNEVDGSEGVNYYSTVSKHLKRKDVPKLKTAAVMAQAAGLSLDELAGIEKPPPHGGEGAGIDVDTDPRKPIGPSVESGNVPRGKRHPGYAFGTPGHYQLIVDFYVVGSDERVVLPFGPHETPDADE